MLLGLVLFYVGAVLILNGLWMLGRIGDREIWVINLFVGAVSLLAAFRQAFGADADAASVRAAALSLLFSLTYLWVAVNRFTGADGRGLGWFSLFVALTTVPVAVDALRGAWRVERLGYLVRLAMGRLGPAVAAVFHAAGAAQARSRV